MAVSLGSEVHRRARMYRDMQKEYREMVEEAANDAKLAAMEHTPHKGDSGTSLTTGALQSHWKTEVKWSRKGFVVYLMNSMQYASFVNDGHRMDRHFVPWLRIDASGQLRKEKPIPGEALFGIVVGTKTRYVPPVPMVEPAVQEFFKRYDIGMKNLREKYR